MFGMTATLLSWCFSFSFTCCCFLFSFHCFVSMIRLLQVEEEVVLLVGTIVLSLLPPMKAEMPEVVEIGDKENGFTGKSNGGIGDVVTGDKQ